MKKISLLIIVIIIYSFNIALAQAPAIEWQNTIGGSDDEQLKSIQQTSDGGYILGGYSRSGISGDKTEASQGNRDYWVVKLDGSGAISWQNTIGGSMADDLKSIQQTTDGGYILGGESWSGISGDKTEANQGEGDYWVVKLDGTGNIVWQNTIGGSGNDGLRSIRQTSDGGYILGGDSASGISGDKTETSQGNTDYWVVKLDGSGAISWQNTIGGSGNDFLYSIQQTSDGGYILCGESASGISGDKTEVVQGSKDYWVVKLDGTGNIVWQNTIGGNSEDAPLSIQQTSDGGYILCGYSSSGISGDKTEANLGGTDYWIVRLDGTGNIVRQNNIGGNSADAPYSIQQTSDGGYILGGYSNSGISGDKTEASQGSYDYWVVKLDGTGNIVWQNTIGGISSDYLLCLQQTTDGGYILGGRSQSGISGDKTEVSQGGDDYWVVKLENDTPPSVNISGNLRDGSNNPIAGAAVAFSNGGATVITSSSGYYATSVSNGWSGTSTATKGSWTFTPTSYTYSPLTSDKTNQNYVGTAAPSSVKISGYVRDNVNIGIGGVDVAFSNGGATVTTNATGHYLTSVSSGWSGTSTATKTGWVFTPVSYTYPVINTNQTGQDYVGRDVILGVNDINSLPTDFTVLPAYPNPFNPSTTISYGLGSDSYVSIQIYDITGQLITTLLNGDQHQGWHSVIWNGTNNHDAQVPAGIYLSRIASDNEVKTTKLMLLK